MNTKGSSLTIRLLLVAIVVLQAVTIGVVVWSTREIAAAVAGVEAAAWEASATADDLARDVEDIKREVTALREGLHR